MTEKEINKLVDKFIPLGHSKACVFEEKYERERRKGLKQFLTDHLGDKRLKIELETKPYGPTEFKKGSHTILNAMAIVTDNGKETLIHNEIKI